MVSSIEIYKDNPQGLHIDGLIFFFFFVFLPFLGLLPRHMEVLRLGV